jgi:hypothetical protein
MAERHGRVKHFHQIILSKTATGNYYGIYKDNQWQLLVSECK